MGAGLVGRHTAGRVVGAPIWSGPALGPARTRARIRIRGKLSRAATMVAAVATVVMLVCAAAIVPALAVRP